MTILGVYLLIRKRAGLRYICLPFAAPKGGKPGGIIPDFGLEVKEILFVVRGWETWVFDFLRDFY
jgi:hypothetical protein